MYFDLSALCPCLCSLHLNIFNLSKILRAEVMPSSDPWPSVRGQIPSLLFRNTFGNTRAQYKKQVCVLLMFQIRGPEWCRMVLARCGVLEDIRRLAGMQGKRRIRRVKNTCYSQMVHLVPLFDRAPGIIKQGFMQAELF